MARSSHAPGAPVRAAAALLLLAACSGGPDHPRGWRVEGARLLDAEGRERILHGFNVSNEVKYPPYATWAGVDDLRRLHGWGMSAVRVLTTWAALMPQRGEVDAQALARLDERVTAVLDAGLFAIVDMHQDIFGEGFGDNGAPRWACDESLYAGYTPLSPWFVNYFQQPVITCFDRFWTDTALQDEQIRAAVAVAKRFRDRTGVIGFDLFNEPFWGSAPLKTFHSLLLQPFYERFIAAVEKAAPGYVFFVEPALSAQTLVAPIDFVKFSSPNVVYAPHYYDAGVHNDHRWDGNPEPIAETMGAYAQTAAGLGAPWLLGEWGGLTDSVRFDDYLRAILATLEQAHAGALWYEYSRDDNGFAPLMADGSEKRLVVDLLARVGPKAVAGRIVEYRFDDRTGDFSLTFEAGPGASGPTLIAFPAARHYPGGYEVACSDGAGRWAYEASGEAELRLRVDPATPRHTVTIRRRAP